jgi:hypothetical protein
VRAYTQDELGLPPAQAAAVLSLAGLPWMLKPLIGFISDTLPLLGSRRKSYLVGSGVLAAVAYACMGWGSADAAASSTAAGAFMAVLLAASAAGAVSDVVVDSLVVERARHEEPAAAGGLQSLCWASYAAAQVRHLCHVALTCGNKSHTKPPYHQRRA